MTQKYKLVPVIFSTKRTGAFHARLAVAKAIDPENLVVVDSVASFVRHTSRFRSSANEVTRHNGEPLQVPVVINYSPRFVKQKSVIGFANLVPHALTVCLSEPAWHSPPFDLTVRFPYSRSNRIKDRNYVDVDTIPNLVNSETLAQARKVWEPVISPLRREDKLVAIFFGGDDRDLFMPNRLKPEYARFAFNNILASLGETACDFVLTDSTRTSNATTSYLQEHIAPHCIHSYFVSRERSKPNPANGYRALADAIVVTPDSMSMISEGLNAKRTFVTEDIAMDHDYLVSGHAARFHSELVRKGLIHELQSTKLNPLRWVTNPLTFGSTTPVNSELQIADAVRNSARQKWPTWELV